MTKTMLFSCLVSILCVSAARGHATLEDLQRCHSGIAKLAEGPSVALHNGLTALPAPSGDGFLLVSATQIYFCKFGRDEIASGLLYHYRVTADGQNPFYLKLAKASGDQPVAIKGSGDRALGTKAAVHNNAMVCGKRTTPDNLKVFEDVVGARLGKVEEHFRNKTFKMSSQEKAVASAEYKPGLEKCLEAFGPQTNQLLSKIGVPVGGKKGAETAVQLR